MKILLSLALALSLTSCAGLQTQHQKIGAACETAASGLEAITAAKVAGKVSQGDLVKAIAVYKTTVPFCEPVAESLSSADYSALLRAAATLAAKQVQP